MTYLAIYKNPNRRLQTLTAGKVYLVYDYKPEEKKTDVKIRNDVDKIIKYSTKYFEIMDIPSFERAIQKYSISCYSSPLKKFIGYSDDIENTEITARNLGMRTCFIGASINLKVVINSIKLSDGIYKNVTLFERNIPFRVERSESAISCGIQQYKGIDGWYNTSKLMSYYTEVIGWLNTLRNKAAEQLKAESQKVFRDVVKTASFSVGVFSTNNVCSDRIAYFSEIADFVTDSRRNENSGNHIKLFGIYKNDE